MATEEYRKQMPVEIVCPVQGPIFSGRADMIVVPAAYGDVGITPGHARMLTRIEPGVVRLVNAGEESTNYFVSGGFLEVLPHLATILADTIERAADIDEAAAEKAREKARTTLRQAHDRIDRERAEYELALAAARIKALEKGRKGY
ncbi:F0F1 ATP synthase subunit epsilon [Salinisphaera sp. C84B14]|uniref:F0F1 ATP synthase subunit epsilon n=1 Tax=Salinisphaera sp. C84B14 TaxID=1304155 RepID=UPI00333ECDA5